MCTPPGCLQQLWGPRERSSPASMVCAPSTTAFMPLAHTLLMRVEGTLLGMPALRAAWVAGACRQEEASSW